MAGDLRASHRDHKANHTHTACALVLERAREDRAGRARAVAAAVTQRQRRLQAFADPAWVQGMEEQPLVVLAGPEGETA